MLRTARGAAAMLGAPAEHHDAHCRPADILLPFHAGHRMFQAGCGRAAGKAIRCVRNVPSCQES